MGAAISRFQFLRGDLSGSHSPMRPPWSLPEASFIRECSRCGDCVSACSQHILCIGRGGFPEVDFSRGECLFCGDCVQACASGALLPATETMQPWQVHADIRGQCLAMQGVECRVCADQCEPMAIRFRSRLGGPAVPEMNQASCNGCGACVAVCPAGVIHMRDLSA